jgi:CRP/FNR family transcriptional regulator
MQRQIEKRHRLRALAKIPLFAHLSPRSLHLLAQRVVRRHLEPGEVIFSEGQACEELYVVESGFVKLYKVSKDGREQVLTSHGPGQTLSELPMIDGDSHPFSAAALVKSTLWVIGTKTLETLCRSEPDCARRMLSIVAGRLRTALGTIEELSFSPVRARLAAYLLRTASDRSLQDGSQAQLPNNQVIAAHVGTVREVVSRQLGQLQMKGMIRITGRAIQVVDANALAREAINARQNAPPLVVPDCSPGPSAPA